MLKATRSGLIALNLAVATVMVAGLADTLIRLARHARLQFLYPSLHYDSWIFVLENNNNFQWLFSQHNEHRLVFARLGTLIERNILHIAPTSTARIQGLLLTILNMILLYYLCQSVIKQWFSLLAIWLASCLVLTNPWQWEILYFEFTPHWLFNNTLVLGSTLYVFHLNSRLHAKPNLQGLAPAIILPWLAIYNSGQGFALAFALIVCLSVSCKRAFIAATASTLLAWFFYFRVLTYVNPLGQSYYAFNLEFFLIQLLGGPWKGLFLILVVILPVMFISVPAPLILRTLKSRPDLMLPGLFAINFAVMTTLSRSKFGSEYAMPSRYVTYSLLLPISIILIACESWQQLRTYNQSNQSPSVLKIQLLISIVVLFATVLSFSMLPSQNEYLQQFKQGERFFWAKTYTFICYAKLARLDINDQLKSSDCPTTSKWPSTRERLDYFNGQLMTKPQGEHANAWRWLQ